MAVGAVALGGAVLGGALGWGVGMTMAGIALGWSIGMYAGQALYGEQTEGAGDMEGPRLSDLSVQSSAYGEPIPIVYGSVRIAGNIIWSAGIQEHKKEEDVGGGGGKGGGGGGGGTRTTYSYTVSFAVGVCEGVIVGINKIWMDGKLFQDANQGDFVSGVVNAGKVSSLSVYTGTEDQEPDPVIEADVGEGNVPGFRGTAYVVFEDLELEDYGNRIPNIEFEVALGLQEQNATFQVPQDTGRIAFFDNGYIAASNAGGNGWVQVLDTQGNLLFEWQPIDSDYLVPFQCSPRASSYLSKEMALYIEHDDDNLIIVDAATGETLVEDLDFWDDNRRDDCSETEPANDCIVNPNNADIGWLEEFGWYEWIIWTPNTDTLRLINWTTGGRATGYVDHIDTDPIYGIRWMQIFNDKIYLSFRGDDRILFEYNSWYDIGVWQDDGSVYADVNNPGNYNRKSDVSGTSDAPFAAVTPHGDFVTRNGTTCYLHDGMGPEIQKGFSYDTGDTSAQALDAIVSDIMDRENLDTTEYDVSDLSGISLIGFAVTQSMSAKDALKPLMRAYQFDVVEAEGQIKFLTRGRSLERSFAEGDLAAHEQGGDVPPAVTTTRAQENELPTKVVIGYQDQNADYQVASQYAKRVTQDHFNKKNIRLPIVMTASEALQIAETYLATAWAERNSHSVAVLSENLDLLPGSVIDVAGYRMIAGQMSIKMPGLIEIEGPSEEPSSYQSDSTAVSPEVLDQSLPGPPPSTFAIMMNLPGMERVYSNPGFFIAPYSLKLNNWTGATAYATNDNGDTWYAVDTVTYQTLVATVISAPGVGPITRWDHINSITIRPINDKASLLESASELSVLGGTNLAAMGTSDGNWELLSFLDVVDNEDGTYTLSGLLRGRRGTEDAVSANKSLFVLMKQEGIAYVPIDSSKLGNEYDYKIVSIGGSVQAKSPKPWTSEGDTIKPWSPVYIEGTRNSSDDLTITWLRRSRGEESWNRAGVPLLEQSEEYEVDILDGSGNVVRTLSTSGEDSDQSGVTYTATQQQDDFGAIQSSVAIEVYQMSDTVGRGFPGKATV